MAFEWILESEKPLSVIPYRRKFAVELEGSLLLWGVTRGAAEAYIAKVMGARADYRERLAAEAAAKAQAKAERAAKISRRKELAACQLSLF